MPSSTSDTSALARKRQREAQASYFTFTVDYLGRRWRTCVRTLLDQSIGVRALNHPGGRRRPGRTAADHRRAVEQPHHQLPGRVVDPEDVALAVAVEIAGFGDRPRHWYRTRRAAADHRRAVPEPHHHLS